MLFKNYILILFLLSCTKDPLIEKMKKLDDDSLMGPDRNKNEVRDDVEYYILKKYPGYSDYEKSLLAKYAIMKRKSLEVCESWEKSRYYKQKNLYVLSCVYQYLGEENTFFYPELEDIDKILNNISIRKKCFEKFEKNINHLTLFYEKNIYTKDDCDFKIKLEAL